MGRFGQRPGLSQATGMALVRCILGKFLGVICHCFPPLFRCFHFSPPGARPPRREKSQRRKWELWARMFSGNFAETLFVYGIKIRVQIEKLRGNSFFMSLIVWMTVSVICKNKTSYLTWTVRNCVDARGSTCKYIWIRSRTIV